jgi:hypothetical protein
MTDQITDTALEERLRSADPLEPEALPTEADTEAALRRLLASGQGAGPARRRRPVGTRRARPRALAAGSVAAVAVGTILVLLLGATTSPPAFAVNRNADGTVTVKLIKLSGINGANRRLAAIGVRARIVTAMETARYVAAQHPCQGKPAGTERTITFDPKSIPHRQVLMLSADRAAHLRYYSASTVHIVKSAGTVHFGSATTALRRAQALVKQARTGGIHTEKRIGPVTAVASAGVIRKQSGRTGPNTLRVFCGSRFALPPAGVDGNSVHGRNG